MDSDWLHTREKFPLIEIEGDPRRLGLLHGKTLRERIARCWQCYRRLLQASEDDIRSFLEPSIAAIKQFNPDYQLEIEAIAEGAELPAWQIYALNCRTELIMRFADVHPKECTAVYLRQAGLLGQTWDWMPELERLAVFMRVRRETGASFLMLTEPGIIGKIGVNSKGVAVTLTILECDGEIGGVPVHLLLRSALESETATAAAETIFAADSATMSSMLIADASGTAKGIEIAGRQKTLYCDNCEVALHTNHYLAFDFDSSDAIFQSSHSRLQRARQLLAEKTVAINHEYLQELLTDTENGREAICHQFVQDETVAMEGTLCSLIIDVRNRCIHATPGSPFVHEFETYYL